MSAATTLRRIATHAANPHPAPPLSPLHALQRAQPRKEIHSSFRARILSLLETCRNMDQLKQIQAQMVLTGIISDVFVAGRLIAFCAISDSADLDYCSRVLTHLENPNVFSWNVAIRGYSESFRAEESVFLYRRMLRTVARPDNLTYPFVFKACGKVSGFRVGCEVLAHVLKLGFDSDLFIRNAAIHFCAACSEFGSAWRLFDGSCSRDLVSWNSLINGYAQRGHAREALELFWEMKREQVSPDEVTMIGVISCCTQLGDLDLGKELHRYIEQNGIKFTVRLTNALMDMYVKCGSLEPAELLFAGIEEKTAVSWTTMVVGYLKFGLLDAARKLFYEIPTKDIIPWNAMIAGYVQCKREKEALALFLEMQHSNVKPDMVTMVSLLSACSQIGALDVGLWLHHYIDRHFHLTVPLGTALVDMYAKCGNLVKSLCVFNEMTERNSLTWTAMICGLASHGHGNEAIRHYLEMIDVGLAPDEITFIGVLSACCHAGLVDDGRKFFVEMQSKYNVVPKVKHYSCMVDLLGRAGFLDEAEELVRSMPMKPDSVVLGALFFACRIHCNVSMGEHIALQLLDLDPHDSGIYVLLANLYAEANMRDKANKVRMIMRERQVDKTPGCSSIEVNGIVHEFIVRDRSHPQSKDIYACMMQLTQQMELSAMP